MILFPSLNLLAVTNPLPFHLHNSLSHFLTRSYMIFLRVKDQGSRPRKIDEYYMCIIILNLTHPNDLNKMFLQTGFIASLILSK
jgi:hypothetical protein